jgi:hypothetical protein
MQCITIPLSGSNQKADSLQFLFDKTCKAIFMLYPAPARNFTFSTNDQPNQTTNDKR